MMVNQYLKRYQIVLNLLGPVFIGCNESLKKKEWIYDRNRKEGIILDTRKFFLYLKERNLLESFEEFLLRENSRMIDWARKVGLYPRDIGRIEKYRVDCRGLENVNTDKGVLLFTKDSYGFPYIPGSSLKGALRNVILAWLIEKNGYNSEQIVKEIHVPSTKGRTRFLSREAAKLNQQLLYNKNLPRTKPSDAVNDCMSGLRISDSEPISLSSLIMCPKIDVKLDGSERLVPQVRECLRPGTEVRFEMVIDSTQLNLSVEDIQEAIEHFLITYNESFLSYFKSEQMYTGNVIYLGGGVGFHSKTVLHTVLENRKNAASMVSDVLRQGVGEKIWNMHKHNIDRHLGVSPHAAKLTEYDGELFQLGPCEITITEL